MYPSHIHMRVHTMGSGVQNYMFVYSNLYFFGYQTGRQKTLN
jgi:hypothetical protein